MAICSPSGWLVTDTCAWLAGTATGYPTNTWYLWNTASTTSVTASPWLMTSGSGTISASTVAWTTWLQGCPAIISEKTRQRHRAEVAAYEAAQAKVRLAREAATARARNLLLAHLSPAQRDSLARLGHFDVQVEGRTYRIRQGTHGNVRLLDAGREVRSFCAQPDGVPAEDAMLAQKLMIETDEAAFLRVANARLLQ